MSDRNLSSQVAGCNKEIILAENRSVPDEIYSALTRFRFKIKSKEFLSAQHARVATLSIRFYVDVDATTIHPISFFSRRACNYFAVVNIFAVLVVLLERLFL